MKTFSIRPSLNRKAAGVACIFGFSFVAMVPVAAQDDAKKDSTKSEAAADEDLRNWIEVTVGGNLIHGDKAGFQQRTGQPRDAWGGVTDFHYEQDVGKKGLFEVDGRGIFDAHNYGLSLKLEDPDLGYVKAEFQEYSSYYDLSGGFIPSSGIVISPNIPGSPTFINPYGGVGEVIRDRIVFEAGLTLENKPQVRLRYEFDGREGNKNSTIWGNTARTGITPAGSATRTIVPTINQVNEDRHTFGLDVSHQLGNTEVGIGGSVSFSAYDNARLIRRNPTELSDRFITHREGVDTDLLNAHAFSETDLSEKFKLTTGYSYTRMETDVSGDRAVGAAFFASPLTPALQAFARRQNRDHGFFGLEGGTDVNQHVGTINLMWMPTPKLTVVPSLRIESQDQNGNTDYEDVEVSSVAGVLTAGQEAVANSRVRNLLEVTESLEARYTGVTNWVFYARAEVTEGDGDLKETDRILEDAITTVVNRSTDSTRFVQKYTAGMNWYPMRRLNFSTQYYHKVRQNDYVDIVDLPASATGDYPGFIEFQEFTTDDVNFRVTLRPLNNLTLISRYDLQYTTIDSRMEKRFEVQSAQSAAHILSESITWAPINRLFLQASGSYTMDRLHSPANDILPARLQVAENNYWTASGTVGYALTEQTDVLANYTFYQADNYEPSIVLTGLPLNSSLSEHTIGGSVVHRFSKRMQLTARYAFMTSHDDLFGGYNDFDAHMLSATLRYRF